MHWRGLVVLRYRDCVETRVTWSRSLYWSRALWSRSLELFSRNWPRPQHRGLTTAAGTCSRQRTMSVLPTRAAVTTGDSSHDSKLNAEQSRRKKTKLRLCTLAPHLSKNRTSDRLREVMAWNSAVLRSFDGWSTSIADDEPWISCSTSWSRPLRQALTNFSCSSEPGRPPCSFYTAHAIVHHRRLQSHSIV